MKKRDYKQKSLNFILGIIGMIFIIVIIIHSYKTKELYTLAIPIILLGALLLVIYIFLYKIVPRFLKSK